MRVFAFLLMLTVGIGGTLFGYRVITGKDLVNWNDLGLRQLSSPALVVLTATPTATSAPRSTPTATPTPVPPTATPVPDKPQTMVVGKTDGQGVYLRRTPHLNDRIRPWMDGSRMEILGREGSDGLTWMKVRAPDGSEGFVPEQYLVDAQ